MNITDLFAPSIETPRTAATLAVNILVQSSLIIAAGMLAARLLRRHGAAVQSTVLRVTLVAVLACPFASWMLVAAGVSGFGVELPRAEPIALAPEPEVEAISPVAEPVVLSDYSREFIADKRPAAAAEVVRLGDDALEPLNSPEYRREGHVAPRMPRGLAAPPAAVASEPPIETTSPQPEPTAAHTASVPPIAWMYGVAGAAWSLVAVLLVARILLANVFVLRGRVCTAAADRKTVSVCQQLAATIGVRAPVIRVSSRIQSPCLVGVFCPAILLPATMKVVSRDVLVHELAHLRRRDCVWQLLSGLTTAVIWFQPLVWLLSRRLEQTADDVADDFVVQFGNDRAEYARQLVDIAERYQPEWSAACVGAGIVSYQSSLGKRVVRILDTSRSLSTRTGSGTLLAIVLFGATGTLAAGLLGAGSARAELAAADEGNPVNGKKKDTGPVQLQSLLRDSGSRESSAPHDDSESRPAAAPTERAAHARDARLTLADNSDAQVLLRGTENRAAVAAPKATRRITGIVVAADGKPAAGAFVAVVGVNAQPNPGAGSPLPWGEVLAEATTAADGKFELRLGNVTSKTHLYPSLFARTNDSGIAWRRVDLDAGDTDVRLLLKPQQLIQGRLVDIEGRPAAGLSLTPSAVMVAGDGALSPDGVGFPSLEQPPKAWLPPTTSDDRGHFTIRNVAAGHGVFLNVAGTEKIAPQDLALNTGMFEQRGERDATYRSLVKNMKPGEVATIALAPAQFFEGVVLLGDSGKPAANARIAIWASQQESGGSMISIEGKTNAEGRFRLNPKPGVRFGIMAYPPQGSPYQVKKLNDLRWDSGDGPKNIEIRLDQGLLARGSVVDAKTGKPLKGASVQYLPDRVNNQNVTSDIVTGWQSLQKTNDDGQFQTTVFPGPGTLLVHAAGGGYILQERGSRELDRGEKGGVRMYAHAIRKIDPAVGEQFEPLKIELQPGASVTGKLTDTEGNPIEHAFVVSRLKIVDHSPRWRGFPDEALNGSFQISGLRDGVEYPVYFLDAANRLGATAMISTKRPSPTIVLKPCGSAKARFVHPDGKPVDAGLSFGLHMVVTPGKSRYDRQAMRRGEPIADEDFAGNIDRVNYRQPPKLSANGEMTFPALIPGARYRFIDVNGNPNIAKEFIAKSGEALDLGEIEVRVNE